MEENRTGQAPSEAIVVCGTCDNVYRVHAGRRTCPECGGDPAIVIMTLDVQPGAEEEATSQHEEGGQPAAGETPTPPPPAAGEPEKGLGSEAGPGREPGSPAEGEGESPGGGRRRRKGE